MSLALRLTLTFLKDLFFSGGAPAVNNGLLLEDNSSFILLEDNTSILLLEA